jgi:signal transduction histidine kinase
LTVLAGALLLLMPALAVLQFRWVGQVSDAEQVRMQRNVEIAALQFREAFDRELRGMFSDLQVWAIDVREGPQDRDYYRDRYERWVSNAAHSKILLNVYAVTLVRDELAVRRWDPAVRAFVTLPVWPAVLEPWRRDFEAELSEWRAGRAPGRSRFQGQDSLLVNQLVFSSRETNTSPVDPLTGSRRQTAEQTFGYTVLELNLPFITNELLAELSERHFTHPNGDSYRVAVITSDEPRRVIYRSDPAATIDPEKADARQGFFFGRFGPNRGGPPRGGPVGGPPPPARTPDVPAPGPAPERASSQVIEEMPGRWRLLVQHQSGSLDAAVAGVRKRNLAISFGVLLLMTVTIGLLTVTSRRAQRLAQQQMEFVAGVSHELRTPVAVIKSAAENLSQGIVGNTDRVKRYGHMIEGEARRLAEMVERVLQYAGIESGLGFGAKTPLDSAEIINASIDHALPLLGPDTVTVHREIPESLPPVLGDSAALRSAVQNLVANAVKYGGADRWVGIRAEHVREHRRSEVRITVSDHGSGIPAADLPHIFEPFYRGGDALIRQIHGNGLGLSLVKRIVTAHGGKVTVNTRAGAGSSFTISLPAAEADQPTSAAQAQRVAAHS